MKSHWGEFFKAFFDAKRKQNNIKVYEMRDNSLKEEAIHAGDLLFIDSESYIEVGDLILYQSGISKNILKVIEEKPEDFQPIGKVIAVLHFL